MEQAVLWKEKKKKRDEKRKKGKKGGRKKKEETKEEAKEAKKETSKEDAKSKKETKESKNTIVVIANGSPITLKGKDTYVFVDVFDVINFNLADSRGRNIVTNLNGKQAQYMENLKDGDKVDIYWEEKKWE